MTLKWKPIRHQLQSVIWQESLDFDKLKFGYTVLIWENIYERFENLKTFEVFVKENVY